MSISFGLNTNLSTSQKLTPQMQQAIKLLQLSSIELAQEVQMKLDSNPLLERVEEEEFESLESLEAPEENADIKSSDDLISDTLESDVSDINDTSEQMQDNIIDELSVDSEWEEVYTHAPTSLASPDVKDFDDYVGATTANLQDHIRWQLNLKHLSEIDLLIADYLIDAMNEIGIIELDLQELQRSLNTMASFYQWDEQVEYEQILMVLHIVQSCDPIGVGGRNLAECLQIQLRKLDPQTPYRSEAISLLDAHEYLLSNNIKKLIECTGIKREQIAPTLELIRTLNPSPGLAFMNSQSNFSTEPESYDIPDVLVTAVYQSNNEKVTQSPNSSKLSNEIGSEQVSWQVKLNPETLPKLRVNQEYASLVKRGDNSPENVYLKDNLSDARLFIRSIEERNHNLLKVATCIIERQQAFLQKGATAMQPMILKDVAEAVELHESTVSRLTTSKSILTPQGLFSLKYFFSSHVGGSDGDVSSTAISAMIQSMIDNESPQKPLSDSAIQKCLEEEGVNIARRTVAKYREAMNIASSTQRKQKY